MRPDFLSERLAEHNDRGFSGRVDRGLRATAQAAARRDADDRATFARDHARQNGVGAVKHALQVYIENAIPDTRRHGGEVDLLDPQSAHATGRVDKRVDGTVTRN